MDELSSQDPEAVEDIEKTRSIIWKYDKIDGVQSKRGGAKNVTCTFCDTVFTGCSSSQAFAHIREEEELFSDNRDRKLVLV